ncbi:zinc finger protein Xfin-like [Sitodiplosis mosellana]|uniref:zinc finger protein Xfin-like n=1 Tax=Sitodiplosis mosellana TaxID=263140 RepID=UPI0024440750|nr:zinc finger protein Xfin-like [Sitodiplosis mosellana]XP_055301623.1 zinc finger protein Xfin-like [Sitodiplosis mosellana]
MAAASNQMFTSTPITSNNVLEIVPQFPSSPITKTDGNVAEMVRRRLRLSTDAREKFFECGYCAQTFKLECNLKYHEMVHQLNHHERKDRDQPFVCVVCGMRFGEKSEMDKHREVHVEKIVQKCSYCNKKYGHEEHLQRHERIHEWIDSLKEHLPFECNDSELIFQSEAMPEPPLTDTPMQSKEPHISLQRFKDEPNVGPENDAVESKRDDDKSNSSEIITISISSDTDSNIDDGPSPEITMAGPERRSTAENQVADCPRVQRADICDKEVFKCAYCDLTFEQIDEKLKHECHFHKPTVILNKVMVKTTVVSINVDVPTGITAPKADNNRKVCATTQKPIQKTKQDNRIEESETHKIDLIAHNIDEDGQTKNSQKSNETEETSNKISQNARNRKQRLNRKDCWPFTNFQPKFSCSECRQRFTTEESRDIHRKTHSTEEHVEPIQIETSPNVVGQSNQVENELSVVNEVIDLTEPEIAEHNNDATVQKTQPIPIETNFKCSHCDWTFAQNDDKLKHECLAHSSRVVLQKIENDATSNGIVTMLTEKPLETKNDSIVPKKNVQSNEMEINDLIELDIDAQPNNNKRKRSKDDNDQIDTDNTGKRARLAPNPAAINQQFNVNSSIVNDLHLEFNDESSSKRIAGRKSKENVQQQQKQAIDSHAPGFWRKHFLGIDQKQLLIATRPAPR